MNKEVIFGKEAREKLALGAKKITDAVRVTMGAAGKCVLIGNGAYGNDGMVQLPTIVTKDGYTVTKHFELKDVLENRGAMMIKEAAEKTVTQAGDSTTATCVLAESMISEGVSLIDNGANSQELKRGIEKGVELAVEELKKISIPVSGDNNKIFQVATVSANNDPIIGRYIADAFAKIGEEGIIDIQQSKTAETNIKISDGYKWNKGFISPLFVNVPAKETCEFQNPLILLYEKKITHHTQVQRAAELSLQSNRPLLIICEDAEQEGLAFLAMNNYQKRISVCVVKAPEFGEARRESMEDLALMTGGTYISDIRGVGITDIDIKHLGGAKKVVVTKEETVIIEGEGAKEDIEEFVNDLKMNLTQAQTEDEKYVIEKRIARLRGGVAVIEVGAATESELGEKLDRYDDAVRATKAAIAEGYVAGGGTAFARISQTNWVIPSTSISFANGIQLVKNALQKPLLQISENAGLDSKSVLNSVLAESGNVGYNVKSEKVEDLIEAGIIDSTKALRCALTNAASVAGTALISECMIVTTF